MARLQNILNDFNEAIADVAVAWQEQRGNFTDNKIEQFGTNILRPILVNEGAGLHNRFIWVVNLHTAAIGDMKQILIMAVDKSDFLTIRVALIRHLLFPPLSNSMLNFVLPSSDTSIKTVASKVLPVLSDLQFLSFTLPEPSSFCAVAEVMLLPILAK